MWEIAKLFSSRFGHVAHQVMLCKLRNSSHPLRNASLRLGSFSSCPQTLFRQFPSMPPNMTKSCLHFNTEQFRPSLPFDAIFEPRGHRRGTQSAVFGTLKEHSASDLDQKVRDSADSVSRFKRRVRRGKSRPRPASFLSSDKRDLVFTFPFSDTAYQASTMCLGTMQESQLIYYKNNTNGNNLLGPKKTTEDSCGDYKLHISPEQFQSVLQDDDSSECSGFMYSTPDSFFDDTESMVTSSTTTLFDSPDLLENITDLHVQNYLAADMLINAKSFHGADSGPWTDVNHSVACDDKDQLQKDLASSVGSSAHKSIIVEMCLQNPDDAVAQTAAREDKVEAERLETHEDGPTSCCKTYRQQTADLITKLDKLIDFRLHQTGSMSKSKSKKSRKDPLKPRARNVVLKQAVDLIWKMKCDEQAAELLQRSHVAFEAGSNSRRHPLTQIGFKTEEDEGESFHFSANKHSGAEWSMPYTAKGTHTVTDFDANAEGAAAYELFTARGIVYGSFPQRRPYSYEVERLLKKAKLRP